MMSRLTGCAPRLCVSRGGSRAIHRFHACTCALIGAVSPVTFSETDSTPNQFPIGTAMKSSSLRLFLLMTGLMVLPSGVLPLSAQQPKDSAVEEKRLLQVLRSDAPAAQKAITCKELAIHGSGAAVPDLAKLLPNPQLSSWSRIALEAIPGEQSDAALRQAAESLRGQLLVGVINSIGVRRDKKAVPILIARLQDGDLEVAAAAAVAAQAKLRQPLKMRRGPE